jgi:membrane dipeptidase
VGDRLAPFREDRRKLLKAGVGAATAAVAFPMVNFGEYQVFADTPKKYSARAVKLVESSLVIDMLAPLTLDFTPKAWTGRLSDEKVAEFRASGITGFHNSIGIGGPSAFDETLEFMLAWSGFIARNAEVFSQAGTAADLDRCKAEKRICVIQGMQNADHFRTPEDVKTFYQLGQRCSQLTYNSQNLLGSGSTEREDGGVSDYGVEIIKAMNAVGMLVDVSHSGDRTTLDAIALSPKPIAITHSNCRALNEHPRLKTDEAIIALAKKGGVMGISGVRMFVKHEEPTTVENIVDHIDHVVKLTSIDHVGIGSDADINGYDDMDPAMNKALRAGYKSSYAFREKIDTDGYDSPKKIYDLPEALIRRGYSDPHIQAMLGGNFRRLLGATWL